MDLLISFFSEELTFEKRTKLSRNNALRYERLLWSTFQLRREYYPRSGRRKLILEIAHPPPILPFLCLASLVTPPLLSTILCAELSPRNFLLYLPCLRSRGTRTLANTGKLAPEIPENSKFQNRLID